MKAKEAGPGAAMLGGAALCSPERQEDRPVGDAKWEVRREAGRARDEARAGDGFSAGRVAEAVVA
jgi:hypothetical protein